jgi:hypothetical protein
MQTQEKLQQCGRNRVSIRKHLWFALLASVVLVLAGASVSLAGSVAICHVPPGNPGNTHIINVGPAAVKHHVKKHGDAVCAAGDRDCCLTDDGALCTNLADDPFNCGECGNSCAVDETCVDGACVCEEGLTACGDSCVDTDTDSFNCGGCGIICTNGQCSNGGCVGIGGPG